MSLIEKMLLSPDFNDLQPYFYNNPWALRCELGQGEDDAARTRGARERALAIYHILFPQPADAVVFSDRLTDYTWGEDDAAVQPGPVGPVVRAEERRLRHLWRWMRRGHYRVVRGLPDRFDGGRGADVRNRLVFCADGAPFDDEGIIAGEASEFGFGAGLVSFESECALWVYDDRGCDVVFAAPEKLLAFYDRLEPYFLDYDRAEMARRRERALRGEPAGAQKRLLVTGFDPFGGESVNPAWEAVSRLPDEIGRYRLDRLRVPTIFGEAGRVTLARAEEFQPDAVLCVGQAGGRGRVTPEMVALNLRFASAPDNAGRAPRDEPVVPGGPDALFATLPARAMAARVAAAGVPAAVSYSAGTYVCNDLMYSALHAFRWTHVRAGFIHVPFLPGQAKGGAPSLPLQDIVRALIAAIEALDEGGT